MKTVCIAVGLSGLLVIAVLGQNPAPVLGKPSGLVARSLVPVATQTVARATNTVAAVPAAPAVVAPAAVSQAVARVTNVVTAAPPAVVTPPAVVPVVTSQVMVRADALPLVVTPFQTNVTARTPAGITNALGRWGAWAPGDKEGEIRFPTDRAVLAALNWLQREQQADGSWKGSKEIATPMLTSLALLVYLGHGETPAAAVYGPGVRKALDWLLADQEENGWFKGRDDRNYTHPIAALALAEAYGLTLDPDIKAAAEKAVVLIVKGQHPSGGFSYNLDKAMRDDTSYMCWCAQALAVARMVKLEVPGLDRAIEKAVFAMRQNADPAGGFGESSPGRTSVSGAGVVGLQFLGTPRAPEVQKTLQLLATNTFSAASEEALPFPGASRFYASWNLTQARFQAGDESFRAWNKSLARELTGSQTHQRGLLTKWVDLGRWERRGASDPKEVVIQDTCFATLMLEVYYRYLPMGK